MDFSLKSEMNQICGTYRETTSYWQTANQWILQWFESQGHRQQRIMFEDMEEAHKNLSLF